MGDVDAATLARLRANLDRSDGYLWPSKDETRALLDRVAALEAALRLAVPPKHEHVLPHRGRRANGHAAACPGCRFEEALAGCEIASA